MQFLTWIENDFINVTQTLLCTWLPQPVQQTAVRCPIYTGLLFISLTISMSPKPFPHRKGSNIKSKYPNLYLNVHCIALSFPSFSMHCPSSHTFITNNALFIYINNSFLSGDNFHSMLRVNQYTAVHQI